MKPYNKRTIVKLESRMSDTIEIGGKKFVLDPVFRQYWNTIQLGQVVECDRNDIIPGNVVYVHHFVNAPEQKLPTKEIMSYLEYNQVYAIQTNQGIEMLTSFVLVEPVTYEQAGLVKSSSGLIMSAHSPKDKIEKIGILRHMNPELKTFGYKEGDIILFNKNCEYEMLIDGEVLYRMENRDVITTLDSFDQLKI
jgi:co-chaperonin GroES (HSP10)